MFQLLLILEKALKSLSCLKSKPYAFQSGTSYQAVEDDHIPFMEKGEFSPISSFFKTIFQVCQSCI